MTRTEARQIIREAAAKQRRRTNLRMAANRKQAGMDSALLPLPKLQQAVCIVRRKGLVDDEVLVAAGFNPPKRRKPKGDGQAA